MVNTGKPSSGCGTCRARRIKCDERKPTCFRCQKSKRECLGYRNPDYLHVSFEWKPRTKPNPIVELSELSNTNMVMAPFWSPEAKRPQPTSPPQSISRNRLFGSPTSMIPPPIEDQAICNVLRNFVMTPCHGNSSSYMAFIVPTIAGEKSLESTKSPLSTAVMAVSFALLGNSGHNKSLLPRAAKQYSKALQQVNDALRNPQLALEDQTLATVITLGLFEALTSSNHSFNGWSSHANGAAILVKMREGKKRLSPQGHMLHVMVRSQMTINCFLSSTSPPMDVDWWMEFGNNRGGMPSKCGRLNLETADLHTKIKHILTEAEHTASYIKQVLELVRKAKELEQEFKTWEGALPKNWQYTTTAWIDAVDYEDLETAQAFSGRLDEYEDISIATTLNTMRVSRIILAADTVRASAWVCSPDHEYRIVPEYLSTARISQELIEDIIASVPMFLGVPNTGKGHTKSSRSEMLGGQSTLALFIAWPLYVTTLSDCATEAQREWALGRLRFIGNERGIAQAITFSKMTHRLPYI